jgi:hypothetical protein
MLRYCWYAKAAPTCSVLPQGALRSPIRAKRADEQLSMVVECEHQRMPHGCWVENAGALEQLLAVERHIATSHVVGAKHRVKGTAESSGCHQTPKKSWNTKESNRSELQQTKDDGSSRGKRAWSLLRSSMEGRIAA